MVKRITLFSPGTIRQGRIKREKKNGSKGRRKKSRGRKGGRKEEEKLGKEMEGDWNEK